MTFQNPCTCDANAEELSLLRCLRDLAASGRPVEAGLPQGLVTGGSALPGYRLVTSWTEIFSAWQSRHPELIDLLALKRCATGLCQRHVRFADAAGETLVTISLLSSDAAGLDRVGLEVWLSGYVDLVLDQP